jgi:pyruvate,water dikinase
MTRLIAPLEQASRDDVAAFGGKAAHLGELCRAGLPVPEGFVVTTEACRRFMALAGLPANAPAPPDARARIVSTAVPADLADELLAAHRGLFDAHTRVAVRSSATTEDLAQASFAGQHATYYHVDAASLVKFVRDCWASLFSESALAYRTAAGVDTLPLMAVIVQRLVPARVSGVAFTADPMGDDATLVIESAWGMGAAIVDGRVTPDRYRIQRGDLAIRDRRIADKRVMVPPDPRDGRLQPVPLGERCRPSLSDAQAQRIASLALRCEALFGARQDVEWAIAGEQVYVLQSRPVTTSVRPLRERTPLPGHWVLFKSVVENFTEPLTPLTADLMAGFCPPFVRIVDGRLYTSLEALRAVIPARLSDRELVAMALLRSIPRELRVRWLYVPVWLLIAALYYLLAGVFLARTRRLPAGFLQSYGERARALRDDPGVDARAAIADLWVAPRFLAPAGDMALQVNLASVRYVLLLPVLRWLLRRWYPDLPGDATELLAGGMEHALSTEMSRGIRELAARARGQARVREIFGREPLESLHGALRACAAAQDFVAQLDAFLRIHGHRTIKEFDLSVPRWHEDPTPVLGMIRNLLRLEALPEVDRQKQRRQALWSRLRSRMRGPRGWVVRFLVERIRYYARMRENSRFYHIMLFDVVRSKLLRQERALLEAGRLRCAGDIHFLHQREICLLAGGKLDWRDVEPRIRSRRRAHTRCTRTRPPTVIGLELETRQAPRDASRLTGFGASPGIAEGAARVILDPASEGILRSGEILVAPYTDPAWTPLFLSAGAAVVEVGSYLSHAGTIAREFGLPCVVDVAGCTRDIRTGDRLRVDGTSGEVWILGRAA